MISTFASMWKARKLVFISLALSIVELAILICIRIFATHHISHSQHSVAIKQLIAATVLLVVPMSVLVSIVGIFFDSRRSTALLAVFAAVGCWFFCFLQTLV